MLDLKPLIFVLCRLTADFRCAEDSQGNRHPKQRCLSVRELPTQFQQGGSSVWSARIIAPGHPFRKPVAFIDTSGRLQQGRKQAQNSLILFREFPPPFPEQEHTPSGLRADIQGRHKSYPMPPRADASQNPRRLRKWWAV